MNTSDSTEGPSASDTMDKRIAELGDWRGLTLSRMRKLVKEADPDGVEERKLTSSKGGYMGGVVGA